MPPEPEATLHALIGGGLLHPDDSPGPLDQLLAVQVRARRRRLAYLQLSLGSGMVSPADASRFSEKAALLLPASSSPMSTPMFEPAVQAWFAEVGRVHPLSREAAGLVERLGGLELRVDERPGSLAVLTAHHAEHRLATTLPRRWVSGGADRSDREADELRERIGTARRRLAACWPAFNEITPHFLLMIVMATGGMRSASSQMSPSVVLVSPDLDDDTLLETIVHEVGHQILYALMEAVPLIDDIEETVLSPWTGRALAAFSFYHAFYVYLLMAEFHRRQHEATLPGSYLRADRYRLIVEGLTTAAPLLASLGGTTEAGDVFAARMIERGRAIVEGRR